MLGCAMVCLGAQQRGSEKRLITVLGSSMSLMSLISLPSSTSHHTGPNPPTRSSLRQPGPRGKADAQAWGTGPAISATDPDAASGPSGC